MSTTASLIQEDSHEDPNIIFGAVIDEKGRREDSRHVIRDGLRRSDFTTMRHANHLSVIYDAARYSPSGAADAPRRPGQQSRVDGTLQQPLITTASAANWYPLFLRTPHPSAVSRCLLGMYRRLRTFSTPRGSNVAGDVQARGPNATRP